MVQTAQETALPLKTILTYFDIAKNGRFTPLDRCFFGAFLPKICAKRPVFTISIPSAEALAHGVTPWRSRAVLMKIRTFIKTGNPTLWQGTTVRSSLNFYS